MARPPSAVRSSGRLLNSLESGMGIGNGTHVRICLKRNPFEGVSAVSKTPTVGGCADLSLRTWPCCQKPPALRY